jgi:hypothetical protein
MIAVQTEYESHRNTTFNLLDITKPEFAADESDIDLVIIKRPAFSKDVLTDIARNARGLLSDEGRALFVEQGLPSTDSDSDDNEIVMVNREASMDLPSFTASVEGTGLCNLLQIPCDFVNSAFIASTEHLLSDASNATQRLSIVHLAEKTYTPPAISKELQVSGWSLTSHIYPFTDLLPKSTVLILDELFSPVLTTASKQQWLAIKHLIGQGCKILWLTSGSQLDVTSPDNALVHGLFRTIRAEDRSLHITTLDIESRDSAASSTAVRNVLESLRTPAPKTGLESEFVERGGVIYVNRIRPDDAINQVKSDEITGTKPVVASLHDLDTVTMLRAERMGTLDALVYSQITENEVPVKDNNVEVEIFAAGLNFKVCIAP